MLSDGDDGTSIIAIAVPDQRERSHSRFTYSERASMPRPDDALRDARKENLAPRDDTSYQPPKRSHVSATPPSSSTWSSLNCAAVAHAWFGSTRRREPIGNRETSSGPPP